MDQPGLNQTDCLALANTRGSCSNYCPAPCSKASCENPGCNDAVFAGGACVTGWVGVGANFQFCVSNGIGVPGVGCVFNAGNSPRYAKITHTHYTTPYDTSIHHTALHYTTPHTLTPRRPHRAMV